MLLNALAPILAVFVVFVVFALRALFALPSGSRASLFAIGGAVTKGLLTGVPLALAVSFAFVPSVSAHVFSSWSCEGYGDVDAITIIPSALSQSTNLTDGSSSTNRLTYYLRHDLV